MLASEKKVGNTTIRIYDDYCVESEEVKKILDRIAAIAAEAN